MWRRTEASMAAIAMVATAAMLLLANSRSCAAAGVVLGSGGNVTYGGGGFVMTEEMELEMLIEDLYFSVHVSRVLAGKGKPSKVTGGTGDPNNPALKADKSGNYDPKANGKNKGSGGSPYSR